jgi:hypothetical protein
MTTSNITITHSIVTIRQQSIKTMTVLEKYMAN